MTERSREVHLARHARADRGNALPARKLGRAEAGA
jgi:hypothetical protein